MLGIVVFLEFWEAASGSARAVECVFLLCARAIGADYMLLDMARGGTRSKGSATWTCITGPMAFGPGRGFDFDLVFPSSLSILGIND